MSATAPQAPAAMPPAPTGVGGVGMWIFLATDVMGFGGLFIAYGVLRARAPVWPDARTHLPLAPGAVLTFALVLSAFAVAQVARAATSRGRRGWLLATALLGAVFLLGELAEYRRLAGGPAPLRLGADLYGATFYALTGYHGLHVAAGVLGLGAALFRGARGRTVEVLALYWQFVDLAWMPIFTFLYLWPAR